MAQTRGRMRGISCVFKESADVLYDTLYALL